MASSISTRIVFLVFFLSGASALIFETSWFHISSIVLGSSVWSAAAVLAAFMSGLATGTYLVSIVANQYHRPQRIYLYLEVIIGITGALAVFMLPVISPVIIKGLTSTETPLTLLSSVRFVIAFIVLLIPATAMGATLPLLVKYLHSAGTSFHKPISLLYGWNTIGAFVGVIASEYLLVEFFGIKGSALFASMLNLTAALLIYRCADLHEHNKSVKRQNTDVFVIFRNSSWQLLLPFLAGFVLLALEIIWFRYLLLIKTGTSEIFAIMLATVLFGIGIGGLAANMIKAKSSTAQSLLHLPMLAALLTIGSFYAYQQVFVHYIADIYHNTGMFILAAIILMLPVSVISGILFPMMGKLIYERNQTSMSAAGAVTFFNTLGAAAGSLFATFLLLPSFGIERAILILSCIYLLIGLVTLIGTRETHNILNIIKISLATTAVLFLFPYGSLESNYNLIASRSFKDMRLVKVHEGLNETLQYYQGDLFNQPHHFTLVTNGHPMSGSSYRSIRYMKYFVYFPYIFNNNIENVLQISYGVGNTAEAVTYLPNLNHFDVVDISEDIFIHSKIIHDVTGQYPLDDPRTHAHVEDGRFFLQNTEQKYDLITAEPPPPQNSGVVNLYSKEYFQLLKDRLSEVGIVTYWLPVHSLGEKPTLSIIRAFCDVFEDCSMWNGAGLEFMLVGTSESLPSLSISNLSATWNSPLSTELVDTGFDTPELMATTFMADADMLNKLTSNISPVSDYYPKRIIGDRGDNVELANLYGYLLNIDKRRIDFSNSQFIRNIFPQKLIDKTLHAFHYEDLLTSIFEPKRNDLTKPTYAHLINILQDTELNTLPMLVMGINPVEYSLIPGLKPLEDADYYTLKLAGLISERNYLEAERFGIKSFDNMKPDSGFSHFLRLTIISALLADTLNNERLEKFSADYPDVLDKWFINHIRARLSG